MSTVIRPRFGKLPAAIAYSGISRSRMYEHAAVYRGLIKKNGKASLVDFDVLDEVLDDLPVAKIKPAKLRSGESAQ